MRKEYIYFLVDADESKARFKIGRSIDPYGRQKALAQEIDLDKSWQIECNPDDVRWAEEQMHTDYARFRIPAEEIGSCCGMTEWFRIECLERLLVAVQHPDHAEYLGKPKRIEREMETLIIKVPADLKRTMKLATITPNSTLQSDVLWLLQTYYSGEVVDRERQSAMISGLQELERKYRPRKEDMAE